MGARIQRSIASAAATTGGALLSLLPVLPVTAAQWEIQPRVTLSETWSDNIQLSSINPRTDFVTEVIPGVSVNGSGGRVNLDFDYQLGLVHYLKGNGGNRFDNRLQTSGNAELLRQRFFVDFAASAGQVNVSSAGTLSDDTVSVNGNRSNFWTAQVSPYLVHHFGRYADGSVRYTHSRVNNSGAAGATTNSLDFSLTSGRTFALLPWTLDVVWSRTDNTTNSTSETRAVDGSVRYNFNRHYGVRLNAGYEDNKLVSRRGDTSGMTWRATGIWTPSPRTDVEVGYGHDFFGNSVSVDVTHESRRFVISLAYEEESTTSAQQQLARNIFATEDLFGDPLDRSGLLPTDIVTNSLSLDDQNVISRRFGGDLALRGRRTTTTVGLFHDRRSFEVSGGDETVFGLRADVSHTLTRLMSGTLRGSWQRSDFGFTNREDTRWQVGVSLIRQLNKYVNGTLSYSHTENESSLASSGGYKENRVNARFNVVF